MGKEQGAASVEALRQAGLPVYLFPEETARAMAGLLRYQRIRERPEGKRVTFTVDRARARAVVDGARAAGRVALETDEVAGLLAAYGLPMVPTRPARTAAEAIEAASSIGYPVVLKGQAEGLVHKSDRGAVKVDLRNGDEVAAACRAIGAALAGPGTPAPAFLVQPMVDGGHEVILGLSHDPQFGRLLMFGLGGIFVEVMKDVVFRLLPITDVEARAMVRSIRGYRILEGARGGPRADESFLVEAILRLAQLAGDFPEVEQVDINPLIVGARIASGAVVDARVRLLTTAGLPG
jgi:acyl-CoA synthetase (NDP forming)